MRCHLICIKFLPFLLRFLVLLVIHHFRFQPLNLTLAFEQSICFPFAFVSHTKTKMSCKKFFIDPSSSSSSSDESLTKKALKPNGKPSPAQKNSFSESSADESDLDFKQI